MHVTRLGTVSHFGGNLIEVDLGPDAGRVWTSYNVPVAFQFQTEPPVVMDNQRGNAVARHLNSIDGGGTDTKAQRAARDARLTAPNFRNALQEFLEES